MTPATNFFVTLFLGFFGIHKFMAGKAGLGVLYLFTFGLFGIGWLVDVIKAGMQWYENKCVPVLGPIKALPVISARGLVLKDGEFCCFQSPAQNLKVKNVVTGHRGGGSGVSVRVMKGVSIRTGGGGSTAIRGNVAEKTPGTFYITNKRVVMICPKGAFDKPFSVLSGIDAHRDGISFQFGSNNYTVLLNNAAYASRILEAAINGVPAADELVSSAEV